MSTRVGSMRPRRLHFDQIALTLLLYVVLLVFFIPALWIIVTAIRPDVEVNARPPIWIPQHITFDRFGKLLGTQYGESSIPFTAYFRNSLVIAVATTVVSLALGTLAGYAFARIRFRGSRSLFLGLMLARGVPGIALSLPLFVLFARAHLVDTIPGLTLAYVAFNLPFTTWLMDGFFRDVPQELDDAAQIDGCSRWQTFTQVALPLVLPGVAASGIFAFLSSWNEFQLANVLARTTNSKTFPVGLFDFTGEYTVDWAGMCAMSVIMLLPAALFVIWAQRHLMQGLTRGAIK